MGAGFGVRREEMLALADGAKPLLRDVQSLTDWLWYINTKGSLAEAVAATSFAIEGATGDLARKVTSGFESYRDRPGVDFGPKTYRWMKEHARYDNEHPKIALEIVKRYAINERTQTRVMLAAKRSIELIHQALETYRAYSPSLATTRRIESCPRADDRRTHQRRTGFPERRFREWRGLLALTVA
jgi:pyrroloquinoline quinone (PQQ) biosynthesis protein C